MAVSPVFGTSVEREGMLAMVNEADGCPALSAASGGDAEENAQQGAEGDDERETAGEGAASRPPFPPQCLVQMASFGRNELDEPVEKGEVVEVKDRVCRVFGLKIQDSVLVAAEDGAAPGEGIFEGDVPLEIVVGKRLGEDTH